MRIARMIALAGLLLLVLSAAALADEENRATLNYSLWAGAHYTAFDDYSKKVGEYMRNEDEAFPEFKFTLNARKKDVLVRFDSHFFDVDNVFARVQAKKSNRLEFTAQYVSLIHQDGQDMLANLEAREWLGTNPGGKMTTHELTDPGADYNTDRHQIETRLESQVWDKYKVKFSVAHRSILEKGNEQKLSVSHCFSCHVESQDWEVDTQTHQVQANVEATVKDFNFGYEFGFRKFESKVGDPEVDIDVAKHPVLGTKGAEFTTRLIYDGETVNFGSYPSTKKLSHTGRISGRIGKGRLTGSVGTSHTENEVSTLEADALTGNLAYAMPLSKKVRAVARVNALRLSTDDVRVDLPTWREGRPDNNPVDFDYFRYSAQDRIEGKGTLELITRINPQTSLSVLGGYKSSERMDYPTPETAYTTETIIAQGKVRYRKGPDFSGSLKYRYENTQDPLRSERGLLERRGREDLEYTEAPGFVFYYQREDLRFLNVTSLPTDYHEVDLRGNTRVAGNVGLGFGLRTTFDKNADLDTLDVQHFAMQPNVNLSMQPTDGLWMNGGYSFNYAKSRGPVAIPVFDG